MIAFAAELIGWTRERLSGVEDAAANRFHGGAAAPSDRQALTNG